MMWMQRGFSWSLIFKSNRKFTQSASHNPIIGILSLLGCGHSALHWVYVCICRFFFFFFLDDWQRTADEQSSEMIFIVFIVLISMLKWFHSVLHSPLRFIQTPVKVKKMVNLHCGCVNHCVGGSIRTHVKWPYLSSLTNLITAAVQTHVQGKTPSLLMRNKPFSNRHVLQNRKLEVCDVGCFPTLNRLKSLCQKSS